MSKNCYRKINIRRYSLKKYLFGIILGLLLLEGGCSEDTGLQEELTEALGINTLLATETATLKSSIESLLTTSEELEENYKELDEKHVKLTGKVAELDNIDQKLTDVTEAHNKNIEKFEEKITKVKEENKEYSEKIAVAEQQEKEVAAAKQKEVEIAAVKKQQNEKKSVPKTTSKSDKKSTPKTENKTPVVTQDCNIKGSSSGIYHTPGSTYYNRTTNPVAMFCSVEEAQQAGYRAPER